MDEFEIKSFLYLLNEEVINKVENNPRKKVRLERNMNNGVTSVLWFF